MAESAPASACRPRDALRESKVSPGPGGPIPARRGRILGVPGSGPGRQKLGSRMPHEPLRYGTTTVLLTTAAESWSPGPKLDELRDQGAAVAPTT